MKITKHLILISLMTLLGAGCTPNEQVKREAITACKSSEGNLGECSSLTGFIPMALIVQTRIKEMWPDDCFIYEGVLTPRDGYFKNLITKYHADVLVHIDRWIPCLVANGSETMDRIEPVVAVPATSTDREILEALQKDAVDRETIYLEEQLKNQALKDRVDAINSLAN